MNFGPNQNNMQAQTKRCRGGTSSGPNQNNMQAQTKRWAMEVYKGVDTSQTATEIEDEGILEFDLDEEETALASEAMAIVVYYSRKSYSPQFLFSDMVKAWNI
jgi:hypothetical protein